MDRRAKAIRTQKVLKIMNLLEALHRQEIEKVKEGRHGEHLRKINGMSKQHQNRVEIFKCYTREFANVVDTYIYGGYI